MQDCSYKERKEMKDFCTKNAKSIIEEEFEKLIYFCESNKIKCSIWEEGISFERIVNNTTESVTIASDLTVKFIGVRKRYKYRLNSAIALLKQAV